MRHFNPSRMTDVALLKLIELGNRAKTRREVELADTIWCLLYTYWRHRLNVTLETERVSVEDGTMFYYPPRGWNIVPRPPIPFTLPVKADDEVHQWIGRDYYDLFHLSSPIRPETSLCIPAPMLTDEVIDDLIGRVNEIKDRESHNREVVDYDFKRELYDWKRVFWSVPSDKVGTALLALSTEPDETGDQERDNPQLRVHNKFLEMASLVG